METVNELYDEVMNNTKYLEIERIKHRIRSEMIVTKSKINCIYYVFEYIINDKKEQQEIIDELENAGFKVTLISSTGKTYVEIKIEWTIDNKNNDKKSHIIINAKEAKKLLDENLSQNLVVKELDMIEKEIKLAISYNKNYAFHGWKYLANADDCFEVVKRLKDLGYFVDDKSIVNLFIEWR